MNASPQRRSRAVVVFIALAAGALAASPARADDCGHGLRHAYCAAMGCAGGYGAADPACQAVDWAYQRQTGFPIVCDESVLRLVGVGLGGDTGFDEELARFTAETGIGVRYDDIDLGDIDRAIECGADGVVPLNPPGSVLELARAGLLVDLSAFVDPAAAAEDFPAGLQQLVSLDGGLYGVWTTLDLKSLIWYPVEAFEAAGYEVPQTWSQLIALSDQIVADGGTPWCMYFESGDATGWLLTDWIEDILLRLPDGGPSVYDAWMAHDLPFSAPVVREAFAYLGQILFTPGYVFDPGQIATVPFFCALVPMFGLPPELIDPACLAVPDVPNPPGCWLHRQAPWVRGLAGDNELGFFPFPPIDEADPEPAMVGAGAVVAMTRDTPNGRALFRHLMGQCPEAGSCPTAFGEIMAAHGVILANRSVPAAWYEQAGASPFAELVRDSLVADTFRPDASDQMPPEVGSGSFWYYVTQFALGASIEDVTEAIDASWPE